MESSMESSMEQRILGRTGRPVSVVGLGTWQLGADWGDVSEGDALAVLEASAEAGVTFYDTADVYGDGRSEQLVGRFVAGHADAGFTVATKMGRREEQVPANYVEANFRQWIDRSRRNLGTDRLDLVQLHCPPSAVIDSDAAYDVLDALVDEQVIAAYGVSVETTDQALSAIARPHVASVQIILNAFRMKPLDEVLPAAQAAGVGIIARVPLASGLLSGKYGLDTTFAPDDHRSYNRDGSSFDVGETFSGVDYATGVEAAQEFARLVADSGLGDVTPAQVALAWACQQPGVTTVIPGARNVAQAQANAGAGRIGPLPVSLLDAVRDLYDRRIREQVHGRW
jgi:aryl-alcohol dehydrogenase-like predicted oxidoreductase